MSTLNKTFFFRLSYLASFHEYLRPNGSIVNDSTCFSALVHIAVAYRWRSKNIEEETEHAHKACALYTNRQ